MVGTIIPMVNGERDPKTRARVLLIYSISSIVGGVCIGVLLGCIPLGKWLPNSASWLPGCLLAAVAIAFSLEESGFILLPRLRSRWKVPRSWLTQMSEGRAITAYGFCLGTGVLTPMSACLYPVLLWAVIGGNCTQGAIVMGSFGLFRTIPLWVVYWGSVRRCRTDVGMWMSVMGQWQPAVALGNAVALVCIGVAFVHLACNS